MNTQQEADNELRSQQRRSEMREILRTTKTEEEIDDFFRTIDMISKKQGRAKEIATHMGFFLTESKYDVNDDTVSINLHNENGYYLGTTTYEEGDMHEKFHAWLSMFSILQAVYFSHNPERLIEENRIEIKKHEEFLPVKLLRL